jgi:FMN phosphatase YigB (HAD superfamily)
MDNQDRAVFFDCWDTVISFHEKTRSWNTETLKAHSRNRDDIDWAAVEKFSLDFIHGYYSSYSFYEITARQFLTLIVMQFSLDLDCPIDTCVHEILTHLDPVAIPGLVPFIRHLEEQHIYYAILSNTIYTDEDTLSLIWRLVPEAHFAFFLGSARIGVKKPNPAFFHAGLSLAKKKPENSVYIGDSFYADAVGSYEAGFHKTIWLNWRKKVIDDYPKNVFTRTPVYTECDSYEAVDKLLETGELWK